MPELPEVQALVDFLASRAVGQAVAGLELGSVSVLKTVDPPPQALEGLLVTDAVRHGKWIDLDCDGVHLVVHLSRAGWLRWSDEVAATPLRPGRSPIAVRLRLSDGSGFDLTEQGTKKRLAAYIVRDPRDVPQVASLGPEPASLDEEAFARILRGKNAQVKGLLRDQDVIAGVGNAYSDEILHVARLSPFAMSARLTGEQVHSLFVAMQETLAQAVTSASGRPAAELKDAKRAGMRVHGRTGAACPECGDTVREVSFADSSLQYCATCQTGGKPLADRRMSRLLK